MVGEIGAILLKRPESAFISDAHLKEYYEKFCFLGCPDYETVLREYSVFEQIIRDHVPEVYELPRDDRTGLDSIYAHDSVKITRKGAVYFNMGKVLRKPEALATRDFLESLGVPTLGTIAAPGTMEGGDVLWIDEDTVAIGRGYRTNDAGIRQFIDLTKDCVKEHIIVPMPHGDGPDACLHLMSIISFVDTDKAVVFSKYMPVFFREFLLNRGIKLIEIDEDEYDVLGSNLLALSPGKCVLIEGVPKIRAKLLDAGVTVFTYPGGELSYRGTGGPTCLTCPIYRKEPVQS
jgi:N-dimethylarginine dimethylaminohydrolase